MLTVRDVDRRHAISVARASDSAAGRVDGRWSAAMTTEAVRLVCCPLIATVNGDPVNGDPVNVGGLRAATP